MITAAELTAMIVAETDLSADPPVSDEALDDAARAALQLWGGEGAQSPLSSAA